MKDPDEDVAYEIMRQKKLDASDAYTKQSESYEESVKVKRFDKAAFEARKKAFLLGDWANASITTQNHQKVGVVVPFSRTVDRDPNPRITLSVPGDYIKVGKKEALFWAVIVGAWLAYLFFGPGEW